MAGAAVDPIALRAAQLRGETWSSVVGEIAVVLVTLYVSSAFAAIADPRWFGMWLAAMAVAPTATAVLLAIRHFRRPDDAETASVWLPSSRGVRTVLNLAVIASPWVLLPAAEPLLRALMLMLYIWFMATEVLASTDPHGMTWVALLGVPVSLGAFLLEVRAAYAWELAIFLGLTGASLFVLGQMMLRTRTRAIEAKLAFDAAGPTSAGAVQPIRSPAISPRDGLTRRQIEVLRLLAEGRSNKDIARELGVSPATVKTHVAQVIAITGAANRTGTSMRAASLGLL